MLEEILLNYEAEFLTMHAAALQSDMLRLQEHLQVVAPIHDTLLGDIMGELPWSGELAAGHGDEFGRAGVPPATWTRLTINLYETGSGPSTRAR